MSTDPDKKEVYSKVNSLKTEIRDLRIKLNALDKEKESWFSKKEELQKKISESIGDVKETLGERNKQTRDIRSLKRKRNDLNSKIREKIEEIKKYKKDKEDFMQKHNIKKDPSSIKMEIDSLELKIETEGLSFDKEKQLMKRINELRKVYKQTAELNVTINKISVLSKEIDLMRQDADSAHNEIQQKAGISQEKHETVFSTSKEVDDLRAKEEEAFQKFIEFKKQFLEVNTQLKAKLEEVNTFNTQIDSFRKETQQEKKKKEEEILGHKKEEVEAKISKGKKLTTADLLVFQRTMNEDKKE